MVASLGLPELCTAQPRLVFFIFLVLEIMFIMKVPVESQFLTWLRLDFPYFIMLKTGSACRLCHLYLIQFSIFWSFPKFWPGCVKGLKLLERKILKSFISIFRLLELCGGNICNIAYLVTLFFYSCYWCAGMTLYGVLRLGPSLPGDIIGVMISVK